MRSNVSFAAGSQRDAFDRLRVSQPTEIFATACEFDAQPLFYENITTGTAVATYVTNTSSVDMIVSSTDNVKRQSRYIRYRPGKSQQIFVSGNFNGLETGTIKRMGYYDDATQTESTGDGIFFEVDETGIFAVRRTSVSGTSEDIRIAQADWNLDPLDGNGPSGVVLDLTKFQVCVFDFGWLGAACIRWGFVLGGTIILVHEEYPSNTLSTPFMRQPSLPIRWEIQGIAGVIVGTLTATCASVQSEGGFNTLGVRRSASRTSALSLSATTLRPLLSIRLRAGYLRASVEPLALSLLADGPANHEIVVLWNPTLANASFAAGASGVVEYDTAATAVSGGHQIFSMLAPGSSTGPFSSDVVASSVLQSDTPLASTYAGVPDVLTLAVRPLSASATSFYGSLIWREFY